MLIHLFPVRSFVALVMSCLVSSHLVSSCLVCLCDCMCMRVCTCISVCQRLSVRATCTSWRMRIGPVTANSRHLLNLLFLQLVRVDDTDLSS